MDIINSWLNDTKLDIPVLGDCLILEVQKRDDSGCSFNLIVKDVQGVHHRVYLDTRSLADTEVMDPEVGFIIYSKPNCCSEDTACTEYIGPVNVEELKRYLDAVPEEHDQYITIHRLFDPFWPNGKINLQFTDSGHFIVAG